MGKVVPGVQKRAIVRSLGGGVLALALPLCAFGQTSSDPAPDMPQSDSATITGQPEQFLAKLPEVTCSHDHFSISAENSTFTSVIAAVEGCLQIKIKLPGSFADERTFLHLGPGRAESVLDDLLSSSGLNYAIVQSSAKPLGIASVALSSRADDEADSVSEHGTSTAAGLPMTGARRLWLASQASSGKPLPSPADEGSHTDAPGSSQRTEPDVPLGPEVSEVHAAAGTGSLTAGQETAPPVAAAMMGTGVSSGDSATRQQGTAPPEAMASDVSGTTGAPVTTNASAVSSGAEPAADKAAGATAPATPPGAAAVVANNTPSNANDPSSVLNRQIQQMQQMFEQRRQLNAAPTSPQTPQ